VNNIFTSGQWSQAWLDLRAYAGKTVMLGFYFESHAGSVSSGWYVDDMSIETGPEPGLALPEGFESGWGGWKAQYAGGFATDFAIWEIGKPTSGPGAAHTGTNCAATILGGNYPDDRRSRLVSPAFTVPLASLNPRLRFWHWWSFSSYDFGQLQISTNNGATWDNLSSQYTTSSGGWTYAPPISLSAYAGKTVLLGFYFESYGGGNVSSGWYVDDITILANGYTPMITAQPTNQTVIAGQPAAFTVEVSPLSSLPLSYQWWFNNTLLQDATNATLSITAAQPIHAGGYSVVVTNLYGAATSSPPATLTVLVRPSITNLTMQPSSPVYEGTNVTFCVAATGTPPLSYQWRWNGAAISGATQSCYTVANVQIVQAGAYSVAVSNVAGGLVSSDLMLAVLPDPSWHTNNVGGTGEGSYCVNNGIFTVNGSGEDIEGTEDAFFFVHKPLSGDGQMVARMLDLVSTNAGAEAGIMLRDGTNSGARHVFLALDSVGHVLLRRRLVENDYSLDNAAHGTNWTWLRLMRMGNTFAGHASTNGVDWSLIWWTTLVNMPTDLEAGLAVTAHKNKAMATAQFDNVTPGGLTPLPGVWPQPGPLIYLGGESGGQAEFQRVGGFKALVGGAVGDRYTVKWSANLQAPLAAWSPLATVTNQWGVVEFLDPQALVNPNRFYRVQRISP
jgi:hypothetical protein